MLLFLSAAALAQDDDRDRDPAPMEIEFSADMVMPSLGVTPGGAKDIGYFRDRVAAGEVPLPEVFTPEGLFSEHDLPLSGAKCQRLVCANLAAVQADLLAQPDVRWLAQVGFDTDLDPATFHRAPLSLVAVVDKSCSMGGEPIEMVKASLHEVVDRLGPKDQFGLVTYGENVDSVLPPTSAANRAALHAAIDRVAIDGSTNMEAGLIRGFALAREARRTFDGTSRVMLFTDERPNTGRTDPDSFMGLAEAASHDGIGMTTIGVGEQFGAELAQKVSSVRGGNLFFFADVATMKDTFGREFDHLVTELGHDLDLVLEPAPGTRIAGVYGVPGEIVEWTPGGGVHLHVATLFLSANDGAIYVSLARTDGPPPSGDVLAHAELSYDPLDGVRAVQSSEVRLVAPGKGDAGLSRGVALVDEVTALKAATALHHVSNDQEGAWEMVHALDLRLHANPDPDLRKEVDLVDQLDQTLAKMAGRKGEPQTLTNVRDPVSGLPRRR